MRTPVGSSSRSVAFEAADLIARLEEERAELDDNEVREIIPKSEAQKIRESINSIIAALKCTLGLVRQEEPGAEAVRWDLRPKEH